MSGASTALGSFLSRYLERVTHRGVVPAAPSARASARVCGARTVATRDDACMTGSLARSPVRAAWITIAQAGAAVSAAAWDALVVGAGPAGRGRRVLARRRAATACSSSRRSASRARRPAATGSRRGRSASSHDMGLAEPLARVPALRRAAVDRARRDARAARGPSTPTSRPTATSCGAATSTRWSPTGR